VVPFEDAKIGEDNGRWQPQYTSPSRLKKALHDFEQRQDEGSSH